MTSTQEQSVKKEEMNKDVKNKESKNINKPNVTVNSMIDHIHGYMKGLDQRIAKRLQEEETKYPQ